MADETRHGHRHRYEFNRDYEAVLIGGGQFHPEFNPNR
jgi:hypothetical protein